MFKILHARCQHCVNWEIPDAQTGFRKGRGARNHITNFHWIIEKAREFQEKKIKKIYLCFIDYPKAFCVDHNKLWKTLKEMRLPDHITCLVKNLYADQEASFRVEKGVWQDCLLSSCLFNLYTEVIVRNARLDELQAWIKISRRKVNNLI